MTTLSFDLHVWPWLSIYLNKSFKMHCYSSRRTTEPNYFEIHLPMRSYGRRMHAHTLYAHTPDWNCKTLSRSPQAGSINRFNAKLWHHENALIIDLWPHPGDWPKILDNSLKEMLPRYYEPNIWKKNDTWLRKLWPGQAQFMTTSSFDLHVWHWLSI